MHHRVKDITGKHHDYLTVIGYHGSNGQKSLWDIRCECGKVVVWPEKHFLCNRSCGCKKKELIGDKNRRHGKSSHPAYAVWRSMLDRCRLPSHHAWNRYGGRGIIVCERWQDFEAFWADMGPTYEHGLTIERVDNSKGYAPENCTWATRTEQARNTRANVKIGDKTLAQIADEAGLNRSTVHYRYTHGVSGSALTAPADVRNRFMTS